MRFALGLVIACAAACAAAPELDAPATLEPHADPRALGWRLWGELVGDSGDGAPAWERWRSSEAVFAGRDDAPGELAIRQPRDIRMGGRVVVPAAQPALSYVLLDDAAVDHIRAHGLASRARVHAAGAAIPAFPRDARAVKLVWYPVRATGVTDVPVWDGTPARADADGNPPSSWPRTVRVSRAGGDGAIAIDRFYHRALDTDRALARARAAWHDDTLARGDELVLVAVHLTTKETADWTWTTYWWHDRPDDGAFAAGRPASIRGWAASYVMDATLDGGAPCTNPWLEARFPGGLASNCVSCHERAALGAREFLPVTAGRTPAADPYFQGKTSTDFMWSLALEAR
nr:hypothetical protein [Kofleriaceae bacterium]